MALEKELEFELSMLECYPLKGALMELYHIFSVFDHYQAYSIPEANERIRVALKREETFGLAHHFTNHIPDGGWYWDGDKW